MIRSVTVTNLSSAKHETAVLDLARPDNSLGFAITDMNGLGANKADVNMSEWVTIDGGVYTSAHLPARTIDMKIVYLPRTLDESVADIRRQTYQYFPIKKKVRLTFEMVTIKSIPTIRRYFIEGYVQENTIDIWSEQEGSNISIVCPFPYFQDEEVEEGTFSLVNNLFHFEFPDEDLDTNREEDADDLLNIPVRMPMSEQLVRVEKPIYSKSTLPVGIIFTLNATGPVSNIVVYNRTTYQRFVLDITINAGDTIVIDTRVGHKRVYKKDGRDTSVIQYLGLNSEWLVIEPGDNIIGWTCESGEEYLDVTYEYRALYEGL